MMLKHIQHWLEFIGGERDDPPSGFPTAQLWWLLGIWWTLLAVAIVAFSGQSSKFIYIDF